MSSCWNCSASSIALQPHLRHANELLRSDVWHHQGAGPGWAWRPLLGECPNQLSHLQTHLGSRLRRVNEVSSSLLNFPKENPKSAERAAAAVHICENLLNDQRKPPSVQPHRRSCSQERVLTFYCGKAGDPSVSAWWPPAWGRCEPPTVMMEAGRTNSFSSKLWGKCCCLKNLHQLWDQNFGSWVPTMKGLLTLHGWFSIWPLRLSINSWCGLFIYLVQIF